MVVVPKYADYQGLRDTGVRKKLWCFGQEHEVGGPADPELSGIPGDFLNGSLVPYGHSSAHVLGRAAL